MKDRFISNGSRLTSLFLLSLDLVISVLLPPSSAQLYSLYGLKTETPNLPSLYRERSVGDKTERKGEIIPTSSFFPSSRPSLSLSGFDVEKMAYKAENITFLQSLLQKIAARKAKEILATVSMEWSSVAQKVIPLQYSEVIILTEKTREAELINLRRGLLAAILNDAVAKASYAHYSATERYKALSELFEQAKFNVETASQALGLIQDVLLVTEKSSKETKTKAFTLATVYLQNTLLDLKAAIHFSQVAQSAAIESNHHHNHNANSTIWLS